MLMSDAGQDKATSARKDLGYETITRIESLNMHVSSKNMQDYVLFKYFLKRDIKCEGYFSIPISELHNRNIHVDQQGIFEYKEKKLKEM